MREVLESLITSVERGLVCAFCEVVETRGSTPQKAGAAMLVLADGGQIGTLGGGCVEAEVRQLSLRLMQEAHCRPEVKQFLLDGDTGWDDGLICGGRMTILLQPIPAGRPGVEEVADYYRRILQRLRSGLGYTEAVVLESSEVAGPGDRYLFDADGTSDVSVSLTPMWDAVGAELAPLSKRPRPSTSKGVAYLPTLPGVTLFLVGAGHVSQATARLAAEADFDVWVLDDREKFASRDRFPQASRILVGDIGIQLREIVPTLSSSTYALVVTRGHQHDQEALYHLAGTKCGYVGMIGSKRKNRLIFEHLQAEGVPVETLARVHAPIGLEIGSQTVVEIAISILAELIAHRNLGREAVRLRNPLVEP